MCSKQTRGVTVVTHIPVSPEKITHYYTAGKTTQLSSFAAIPYR